MEQGHFETRLLPPEEGIPLAAALLRRGELVGIPTETVYGLAADALNPQAVEKIYLAKGRPSDNPLIVHIAGLEQLEPLTRQRPRLAYILAEAFWPGPLTMIFPKSEKVPLITTGGLETVAIRMPSHPVARRLIDESGLPLAAPSANSSGLPSPTRAEHVFRDMAGRIPLILDGGDCQVGLESTVVAVGEASVRLLRPGGITPEMLARYCKVEVADSTLRQLEEGEKPLSPGMKYTHYSPKAQVLLLEGGAEAFAAYVNAHAGEGVWAMAFEGEQKALTVPSLAFGRRGDGLSQAKVLFDRLRECDEKGARLVYAPLPEKDGIGLAVCNRLLRAAGFAVVKLEDDGEGGAHG